MWEIGGRWPVGDGSGDRDKVRENVRETGIPWPYSATFLSISQ